MELSLLLSNDNLIVNKSGVGSAALIAVELLENNYCSLIVAKNMEELGVYKSIINIFLDNKKLENNYNVWKQPLLTIPSLLADRKKEISWNECLAALYSLYQSKKPRIILTTIDNFLFKLPPVNFFDKSSIYLEKNMEMSPEIVLDQLIDWGFVRNPMVSIPGEIAIRGDIVDIFATGYTKPVRLEFFGDTLEEIRVFDPLSQRSIENLQDLLILPVNPILANKENINNFKNFWKKKEKSELIDKDTIQNIERLILNGKLSLPGLFYENTSFLESWLPKDTCFILPDKNELLNLIEERHIAMDSFILREDIDNLSVDMVARKPEKLDDIFGNNKKIYFSSLSIGLTEQAKCLDLVEKNYSDFKDIFINRTSQERPWYYLMSVAKKWAAITGKGVVKKDSSADDAISDKDLQLDLISPPVNGKGQLVFTFGTEHSKKKFIKLAAQDGIYPHEVYSAELSGVFALVSPFRKGLAMAWKNCIILGEDVIQPKIERSRHVSKDAFQGLDRYDTLKEGDLLVHRDYGLGFFEGLHHLNLGGVANDYLLLRYADNDKLYLPVDRLSLVQRFKGVDGSSPIPDKLGGSFWSASKAKAKKAIEKIAADLVAMYALRKVVKGFSYSPIGEIYREFEASFGFEETPDQARAINDVLSDMDKPEPMDRLICGDVGFGKTEVSLRAAFRAAIDGRQVAFLCPTTILAEQHYQTFRARLSGFPVNVGLLSRFVSKKKQQEVLEGVKKGQIDILIGTHRLLSGDVEFSNLGLLVLDEEQRFGVRHKEKLKELKKNVDSLTLTATPIPRTLQLSLSGIRELSVIETPPLERKPIVTAIIEKDEDTIKTVIERELSRNGQVFWVYNRVQGLEEAVKLINKLVPSARVGMAHGQMTELKLEDTMRKFWLGELDVLVATSIIESGLDFPRANTLIVDKAHMLGLGQLYQLRGRVGRSDRQAFAIFIVPDQAKLSSVSRQRLQIISDMDYLGAGFQIAMEDLRIRGAGNILGESQSGHMNRLGIELFLEMLEESVAKLKGETIESFNETEISIGIPAYIPESYIVDNKDRLRYYKMFSSARTDSEQDDIMLEIQDRFGLVPKELASFSAIVGLKRTLTKWGVERADVLPNKIKIHFGKSSKINFEMLVPFVAKMELEGKKISLQPPAILEMPINENLNLSNGFSESLLLLEPLLIS